MLKYFIHLYYYYFFYIEFNFIILYSSIGIIKIKNDSLTSFFCRKKILFSIHFNPTLFFFLKHIFLTINFGYKNKFTLVGVGYRQYYSNNIIVYKLWYSHLVYKILPLDVLTFKKKRKRKYFTLFSIDKTKVNTILHLWLSYRRMNIYTKKGFYRINKLYYYKPIIKKLI